MMYVSAIHSPQILFVAAIKSNRDYHEPKGSQEITVIVSSISFHIIPCMHIFLCLCICTSSNFILEIL